MDDTEEAAGIAQGTPKLGEGHDAGLLPKVGVGKGAALVFWREAVLLCCYR